MNRQWETWHVATLLNWQDEAASAVFKPGEFGMDQTKQYHVFDQWEGKYYGKVTDAMILPTLKPHDAHVLSVHEDKGRPQIVGATMHLLGDAQRVVDESWENNTLKLSLTPGKAGDLFINVPDGYISIGQNHDRLIKVSVGKDCEQIVLPFEVD